MLKRILYFVWVTVISFIIAYGVKSGSFSAFMDSIEYRTFDIKQRVIAKSGLRKPMTGVTSIFLINTENGL